MALTKLLAPDKDIYDGERIWKKFTSMGAASTTEKLNQWCESVGMVNEALGKVSHMGPTWAMWRYAFRNPEEAYPQYKSWAEEYRNELVISGKKITKELFYEELSLKGKHTTVVGDKEYFAFCEKYKVKPKKSKKSELVMLTTEAV